MIDTNFNYNHPNLFSVTERWNAFMRSDNAEYNKEEGTGPFIKGIAETREFFLQ
jgi:hypothetical protein